MLHTNTHTQTHYEQINHRQNVRRQNDTRTNGMMPHCQITRLDNREKITSGNNVKNIFPSINDLDE
jgi:hypothetical protein